MDQIRIPLLLRALVLAVRPAVVVPEPVTNKGLNAQFKAIVISRLQKDLSYEQHFSSLIFPFFRDIFYPTIIDKFYRQKDFDNFLEYINKTEINEYFQEFPQGESLLESIKNEFNYNLSTFNIDSTQISKLGDLHQAGNTKFLIENKTYYITKSKWNSLISELLKITNLNEGYLIEELCSERFNIRKYIEPLVYTNNIQTVKKYYYNLGKILPLLLAIRANDLILENVIAVLPYPVFIDLETIFTPLYTETKFETDTYNLLSSCFFNYPGRTPDFSLYTGGREKLKSYLVGILKGTTNKPYIQWDNVSRGVYYNIPFLYKKKVAPEEFLPEIIKGYQDGSNIILKKKDVIWSAIKNYENKFRIILRPTYQYRATLLKYYFPTTYRSHPNFKIYLKEKWKEANHILAVDPKTVESVIESEVEQLFAGTMPYFSGDLTSSNIYDSKQQIVGNLKVSPIKVMEFHFSKLEDFLVKNDPKTL